MTLTQSLAIAVSQALVGLFIMDVGSHMVREHSRVVLGIAAWLAGLVLATWGISSGFLLAVEEKL